LVLVRAAVRGAGGACRKERIVKGGRLSICHYGRGEGMGNVREYGLRWEEWGRGI